MSAVSRSHIGGEDQWGDPGFLDEAGNTLDTWTFTDTHLFSNRLVGEGRLSLTSVETEAPSSPAASHSPRELGFQFEQGDAVEQPRIPAVTVSGVGGVFNITSNGEPWVERSRLNGGNYRLSWLTGTHSMKFGYEYLFRSQFLYSQGNSSGTLAHNGASTRSATGDGGIGMADFLVAARPTSVRARRSTTGNTSRRTTRSSRTTSG